MESQESSGPESPESGEGAPSSAGVPATDAASPPATQEPVVAPESLHVPESPQAAESPPASVPPVAASEMEEPPASLPVPPRPPPQFEGFVAPLVRRLRDPAPPPPRLVRSVPLHRTPAHHARVAAYGLGRRALDRAQRRRSMIDSVV